MGPFFVFSFGRGAQELETVTRIVVAGRAGRACTDCGCSRKDGGVLVAFDLVCCPRISEGLHLFFAIVLLVLWFFSWSLIRIWISGL